MPGSKLRQLRATSTDINEGCLESIRPFWISREPIAWPWCNLAASQWRPYCTPVNSHTPVGLVSRQWDAVDWACVLCDRRIHNYRASRSASSRQCACPFYSSRAGFFGKASHHPGLSAPHQPRFGSLWLLAFPKAKITIEREEIFWMRWSYSAQAQSTASHCQLTSPTGEWLFTNVQISSDGCQVTSRSRDWFSRYSKWLDIFRTAPITGYLPCNLHI